MQKLCRTQHAMIVWLVKVILLSSCFWRTLQCPFSISNAHSTATLALESSLLKSISSGSLIASLYGFLATTRREDRHCRPTNWASLPYCQLLQLVLVVIHYCLFADITRRFSELVNHAYCPESQLQRPSNVFLHQLQLGPQHHVDAVDWIVRSAFYGSFNFYMPSVDGPQYIW